MASVSVIKKPAKKSFRVLAGICCKPKRLCATYRICLDILLSISGKDGPLKKSLDKSQFFPIPLAVRWRMCYISACRLEVFVSGGHKDF